MGAHVLATEDGATRAVLDSIRRIVQVLRESSRLAEAHVGVSGAQLFVLHHIAETPGLSLNELAARTHTHQSSVSTVVSGLIARRLVRCGRAADDARRLQITLSAAGRRLVARAPGAAQDALIRSVGQLPPRSARQLAALLDQVVQGMNLGDSAAPMFFHDTQKGARQRRA